MDGTNMSVSTYPMYGIFKLVSTITESFFNKNLLPKLKLHKDKTWLQLRAANGLETPYIGYVETEQVTIIPAIFNLTVGHLATVFLKTMDEPKFSFPPTGRLFAVGCPC
jgi:hypothetical protein